MSLELKYLPEKLYIGGDIDIHSIITGTQRPFVVPEGKRNLLSYKYANYTTMNDSPVSITFYNDGERESIEIYCNNPTYQGNYYSFDLMNENNTDESIRLAPNTTYIFKPYIHRSRIIEDIRIFIIYQLNTDAPEPSSHSRYNFVRLGYPDEEEYYTLKLTTGEKGGFITDIGIIYGDSKYYSVEFSLECYEYDPSTYPQDKLIYHPLASTYSNYTPIQYSLTICDINYKPFRNDYDTLMELGKTANNFEDISFSWKSYLDGADYGDDLLLRAEISYYEYEEFLIDTPLLILRTQSSIINIPKESLPAILDRTQEDVDRVKELNEKLRLGTITQEEKAEWDTALKGALNIDDLERISDNIDYILDKYVGTLPGNAPDYHTLPTRWKEFSKLEWYLKYFLSHVLLSRTDLYVPAHPWNKYDKWNMIEQILSDTWDEVTFIGTLYPKDTLYPNSGLLPGNVQEEEEE